MKRLLITMIAVVAVCALVLPASAADFKFGGMFWTKFYSTNNIRDGNDDGTVINVDIDDDGIVDGNVDVTGDDNVNGFYTRMRLYFTAIASENLKAVSKMEVDSIWGDGRIGSVSVDGGSDGRGDAGNASANSGFEIKNAYIDFTIPDTALNFKAGLVGTKLGKSGIVFNDDAPAIIASYTYDPVHFALVYSRLNDNATSLFSVNAATANNSNDDWDMWGLDIGYRHEAFSVNLDVGYVVTGQNQNSLGYSGNPLNLLSPGQSDKDDLDLWIIGVDADYKADVWSAYLTAAFNAGSSEGTSVNLTTGRLQDQDFKGWMVTVGGDYNINDMFTVGLDFYYASGNDYGFPSVVSETLEDDFGIDVGAALNAINENQDAFTTPGIIGRPSYYMDDIVFPGWFDDESSTVGTFSGGGAFLNNVQATGLTRSNQGYTLQNIWSIGAHVDIKPLEQTLIQPGIAYMQFVEDRFEQLDSLVNPIETGTDVGFSAYVRLNQGITDGLALKATFGYLFAGDAYSVLTDDDDAYKFATGLFWSW